MIFGVPKWVQKGEFISVLGGHGAPWAPKSVLGPESCISRPPKVTPRSDNRLKKGAKVVEKLSPNLARRTARSGLNPPPPVKGGTGVFFNRHGSPEPPVLERLWTLRWARLCRRPLIPKSSKNGGLILDPHLSIFGVPKNPKKSIRAEFLGVLEGVLKMEPRPGLQKVRF